MDPLAIVSPHLDDAVLSCGQLMAGRPDVRVITVFTGHGDNAGKLTSYDQDCGFPNAKEAMIARRDEDHAAVELLKGRLYHLGFPDDQYRDGDIDDGELQERIMNRIRRSGAQQVMIPLGLSHPDHIAVSRACGRLALRNPGREWWVYEELPYRVLQPDAAQARLDRWRSRFALTLTFAGDGPLELKEKAIAMYSSQVWALNMHACLVPERHWKLS